MAFFGAFLREAMKNVVVFDGRNVVLMRIPRVVTRFLCAWFSGLKIFLSGRIFFRSIPKMGIEAGTWSMWVERYG
jgi:hypothetical protein